MSNSKVRIEGTTDNKSCSTTWVDTKAVFENESNTKNSPIVLKNVKNNPKIKAKSKIRYWGTIENKSCSTVWVDPKTVCENYHGKWIAH